MSSPTATDTRVPARDVAAYPDILARAAVPVRYRPTHGHYEAQMLRPTSRERAASWWRNRRTAFAHLVLLTVCFLLLYLALNLVIDGANALLSMGGW